MAAQLPSLQASVLDASGAFTQAWVGFFTDLTSAAAAIVAIPASGTALNYTAAGTGAVAITGTLTGVSLIRGRTTIVLDNSTRLIPVASGDVVQMTYTTAPTVSFIPGGA